MATKQSRTATLTKCTCKASLVVNHPAIALTLEKCIIQGKIIVYFTWTEHFFMNYVIFLDIFKLSHVFSTKVTRASLWMETLNKCGKRSVVWKNNKFEKAKQFFWKLIDWSNWNINEIESYPQRCIFRFRAPLASGFPELLTAPPVRFSSMPFRRGGVGFFWNNPITVSKCQFPFLISE